MHVRDSKDRQTDRRTHRRMNDTRCVYLIICRPATFHRLSTIQYSNLCLSFYSSAQVVHTMREKKPINFQEQQKTQNYNTARKKTHLSEISVVRY